MSAGTDKGLCDCCRAEPGVGVAGVPGAPVSIMWGKECLTRGAIPLWVVEATVLPSMPCDVCGGKGRILPLSFSDPEADLADAEQPGVGCHACHGSGDGLELASWSDLMLPEGTTPADHFVWWWLEQTTYVPHDAGVALLDVMFTKVEQISLHPHGYVRIRDLLPPQDEEKRKAAEAAHMEEQSLAVRGKLPERLAGEEGQDASQG